ncbi:hypothetical protein AGOR_G00240080, partial [Albula goreensis]
GRVTQELQEQNLLTIVLLYLTGEREEAYRDFNMISLQTHMLPLFCVILLCFIGGTQGDSVLQNGTMVLAENEKASLYCKYDTTDTAPYLYWYIQLGKTSPELILSNLNVNGKAFKEGFKANPDKSAKTFNLEIAAAGLSDSATYYCALKPTLCESFQDGITAETDTVYAVEGNSVKMSCNYTTTANILGIALHWYRQYPRSKPEFIILIMGSNAKDKEEKDRFTVKHDKQNKSVHLEISSAEVTDSALYYCALRPTVTGNP